MGLGLAAPLSVAAPAEAADTVREGTIRLGVERLVNIGGRLDDPNTAFALHIEELRAVLEASPNQNAGACI